MEKKNNIKKLLLELFQNGFDKENFGKLIFEMFDSYETKNTGMLIYDDSKDYIKSARRIVKYTDKNGRIIEVLTVKVQDRHKLEYARTAQKNFIARFLNGSGDRERKDAALVAFYSEEDLSDWRLSFIEMQYKYNSEKRRIDEEFTPSKRFSFLVGENEPNHTCCERFYEFFDKNNGSPALEQIREIFNVEKVTDEFYNKYRELYTKLKEELEKIRKHDEDINAEFENKKISNELFCKKILGQIVFLYFIQKKGWLGVDKNEKWGSGDRRFLRNLFEQAKDEGKNYFNDYLEHLFYEALAQKNKNDYFELLDCRIPFLNGGLFEPIKGYNWKETDIIFDNKIFSNKTKNNEEGDGILDIFDKFNFTINENEPLETEVAIDPEMLGKVFESMLDIEDRKEKGAFYTPKEIVQYMCQQSLINYLSTKFPNISKESFEKFIIQGDMYREHEQESRNKQFDGTTNTTRYVFKMSNDIINNYKEIDESLKNVKVCDPAIGSGAFPVGIMNEIVKARLNLLSYGQQKIKASELDKLKYNYKMDAIQNSIYGVDIEDSAVEIAKLRFWLSLIIDESGDEIIPMPNLDYKIICGNSLLNIQLDLFNSDELRKLEKLKRIFTNIFNKEQKDIYRTQINGILAKYAKQGQFDFRVFFSEVFDLNGGFDIVIANPPYVGEKGNKDTFAIVKDKNNYLSKYYQGKMDYFYFFFCLGLEILADDGIETFITTNYYITANGASILRRTFKEQGEILQLINFNEGKIFESAKGQHNMITIIKKTKDRTENCKYILNLKNQFLTAEECYKIFYEYEKNDNVVYKNISQCDLYDGKENYIRLDGDTENNEVSIILNKIKANNKTLGEICDVNQGIVSGADSVSERHLNKYDIDAKKGDGIFVLDVNNPQDYQVIKQIKLSKDESKLLVPFFKNSDICRYCTNENNHYYILYLQKFQCNFNKTQIIKHHIAKFIDIINNSSCNSPFLHRPRNKSIFKAPKIVAPQRSRVNTFGYNEIDWYASADVYFITKPKYEFQIKYILGILNSKLYYFWLYHKGKRKGDMLELYQTPLSEIPIMNVDKNKQEQISNIVNNIIKNKQNNINTLELENELNSIIYRIYNINSVEQDIIKNIYPNTLL